MRLFVLLACLVAGPAFAATLSSVTLPDTATVGGQALVLNGLGLREKFFFDIYVGGLYAKAKSHDATALIQPDEPKRIVMQFVYSSGVTKAQLTEAYVESFSKQANFATMKPKMEQLNGYMEDVSPGDQIVLDYVPGTGTTVTVKGKVKGTIEGVDFMRSLWTVYIGPNPPTAALRNGMLGN